MPFTLAGVQPLLGQFHGEGLLVSCYADLSGTPGVAEPWPGPFHAQVTAVREMLADDLQLLEQFEGNLEAVGKALAQAEPGARGLALFSAAQRGFFHSFALDRSVGNVLVVHQSPYLVPLLEALCRQRDYLVVLTDTHRARIYVAGQGRVGLRREVEEEVPRRHRSAGEGWGKQATIARHREDRILHFRKHLIELVEEAWAERPYSGLVLLGTHEVVEHLRKALPPGLAARVVHEAPHPWTEGRPPAVADALRGPLAAVEQGEIRRVLDGLTDRLRHGYAVAAGSRGVLAALQGGKVGAHGHGHLVLGPDPREAVARCTACRALDVDMPAACPRCQAPCVTANLWEEVLLLALRHGVAVHCVGADEWLTRYGGLAAVLPRDDGEGKDRP